jgi:hypothetical protein
MTKKKDSGTQYLIIRGIERETANGRERYEKGEVVTLGASWPIDAWLKSGVIQRVKNGNRKN